MANNRGNSSSSNSNIPSTKDMKDGVHRTNDSKRMEYVDPNTIANINKMTKKYEMYIKNVYGTLEGFEDAIKKATETAIKSQENEEKIKTKFNNELNALAETFGESSKEFKTHLNIAKKEMKLAKNESKETLLNIKKDFIKQSFKNESKQNEIKFLNNKFAKNNNLADTSNEYYNQLEKLKSDALDTYGEGFENNKEYKKALLNLNDEYAKNMKDAWKEDFKENHKVLGGIASGIKDTFERNKESLQGLLGPLNLFIAPLKDFFGGFGAVFKFIGGGVKKLFGKFTKKNPTASDVLKSGAFGVGALYIGSKLEQMFGKTKDKKEIKKGFLDKLTSLKESGGIIGLLKGLPSLLKTIPILGTALRGAGLLGKSAMKNLFVKGGGFGKFFASGATKTALKAMTPMAIVTSILEMVIDAIKGIFKSKEWNVSKVGASIGSALGGASEGGLKSMFAGMGKWALLGASIGTLVTPVIGTLVGGLIGGAIGGILGWIGGKNLAKGFDKLKEVLKNMITNMWEALKDLFNVNKFIAIFKSDESLGKKIGKAIGLFVVTIVEMIPRLMKKLFSGASNLVSSIIKRSGKIKDAIGNLGTSLLNGISNGFNKAKDFAKNTWEGVKEFGGDIWEGLKESELANFVKNIFTSLNEGIGRFFNENPIGKWMDSYIIAPIKNAFGQMGAWFSYIGDAFSKDGITGALSAMTVGMIKKDKSTGLTDFEAYKQNLLNPTNVDDAIIRTDGSVIKTNPKDTLVALKDIPLSMEQVRSDTTKNLNSSLNGLGSDKTLEKKLTTIIDVLSKILAKDVQVNLPPQTRGDLDMIMSGGMI